MIFLFLPCDYCVYHYKSTELVFLYTWDFKYIFLLQVSSHMSFDYCYVTVSSCHTGTILYLLHSPTLPNHVTVFLALK